MKNNMIHGTTHQMIIFPKNVNQPHCYSKPIPLFLPLRNTDTISPVQQPFKQIPASQSANRRHREIPSPSKDIIANIDAGVKRVKSAVISRMSQGSQRKENNQYFGWLLKARLQPLLVQRKPLRPTVSECKGIMGCCRGAQHPPRYSSLPTTSKVVERKDKKSGSTKITAPDIRRHTHTPAAAYNRRTVLKSADNILDNICQRPYKKATVMSSNNMPPIRMITVGKSSSVATVLETKYKCFSAQFCGMYNVPGSSEARKPFNNVLVPRYGMFNAEECYVYEHDAAVQNSKQPVVPPPKSLDVNSFNLELDFMLDKFDSDTEDAATLTQNDINKIANKYHNVGGGIPGMVDWEDMVSSIADGALDMSGSQRLKKEKKSTKLRSPTIFTDTRRDTRSRCVAVKPADLDVKHEQSDTPDVMWYDVNSLRLRNM